jgi:hypothetical protein
MSYVTGIILASLAMAILVAVFHQTWSYLRGQTLISRRQFGLRLSMGALLLLTIGMIFYAAIHLPANPLTALIYWTILTFLPLVVVVLAWLDLKELARTRHQRQAELYRGLADLQHQLQNPPRDKSQPEDQR